MPDGLQKILVVDDLQDWRATLSGLLKDRGYDVEVSGSIANALELLKTNSYDLALLDLRLDETDESNTDGLTLAETIKSNWPQVKVVMITGYGTVDIITKAMGTNAEGVRLIEGFVPKDETNILVQVVQRALTS
jgi:DNA-binding NtrC family response regulator